jgi:hypothetical protein
MIERRLDPFSLDHPPHRRSGRPLRDPALDPPDQLGGLVAVKHAADSRRWAQRRALGIELVPFAELGALVGATEPCPHAGSDNMVGIDDDDALQAPGGILIWLGLSTCRKSASALIATSACAQASLLQHRSGLLLVSAFDSRPDS